LKVTKDERRRAEALDRSIPSGMRGAIDDPSQASGEVAPLATLAAELRHVLAPAPASASLTARVRARVLGSLPARDGAPRPSGWRRLRPAYALAGLLLAFALAFGSTAAYASESALPGDPLYAVKLGVEDIRLQLSPTTAGDRALLGEFADRRMNEIETLARRGRWADVELALRAYPAVVDVLVSLSEDGSEVEAAQLSRHVQVLTRVKANSPAEAQPGLLRALERADFGRQEVERRGHTPTPHPTPTPGAHEPRGPKKTPPGLEHKGNDD
jgi:hypothetical protein